MVKGWVEKTIAEIAPLQRGFDLPATNIVSGEFPIVYSNGIGENHNVARAAPPGVITGRSGTIGSLIFVEKDYFPHNTTLWVTDFKGNDERFIYYLFHLIDWRRFATGSGVPTLNRNDIHGLRLCIPINKTEQHAIAATLSDADAYIAALEKLISKKRNIKQGAMQELLTGKRRLSGFSGEWAEKTLGELLEYEQPQKYIVSDIEYLASGTPVLTAGKSLILGYTAETEGVFDHLPVIIFDDFTTASKLIGYKFKVKSSAMKMLSSTGLCDIRIVFELMQIVNFHLKDHQRYWISEYSKIPVKIPNTHEEQSAIATVLSDMDAEIDGLMAKLNKAKQVKQGMMNELLTGRIRLL